MSEQNKIGDYAKFYERISLDNVDEIRNFVSDDIHFRDPFNETKGVDKLVEILQDMFVQCEQPRFKMLKIYEHAGCAVLKWEFSAKPKTRFLNGGKEFSFLGVSEVFADQDGLVCEHIDYWDSGREFYEKLSVLGFFVRLIKQKLAIS